MKVLLDACVWGGARLDLERCGHETEWAGTWPDDSGDEAILARAHVTKHVLVTLDRTSASSRCFEDGLTPVSFDS